MKPRTYEARNQRPEAGAVFSNVGNAAKQDAWKWEKAGRNRRFSRVNDKPSRLFPSFPTFSHLIF